MRIEHIKYFMKASNIVFLCIITSAQKEYTLQMRGDNVKTNDKIELKLDSKKLKRKKYH